MGQQQSEDPGQAPAGEAPRRAGGAPQERAGGAPQERADGEPQDGAGQLRGLLIDWGGVLTSNLFVSFHAYCVRAGIDPRKLVGRFKSDPEARELLIALETGKLEEKEFERRFAELLEVAPDGLIDGLFSDVRADELMVGAVRRAREGGVRTGLISNSWGVHRYPREMFTELFNGIVISGEEGMRKPSRRMYELGAERAGVAPAECVYVDDLPFNLAPARELGMRTIHHTDSAATVAELERLLGMPLRGPVSPSKGAYRARTGT